MLNSILGQLGVISGKAPIRAPARPGLLRHLRPTAAHFLGLVVIFDAGQG